MVFTHGEGVRLFPGDRCSPRRRPHLLWQRLWHSHEDEADVEQGDGRGQDHHQGVAVGHRQVGSDGRAGNQAGRKRSRYLEERVSRGELSTRWAMFLLLLACSYFFFLLMIYKKPLHIFRAGIISFVVNHLLTKPYAVLLSCSCVMSAT